MRFGLLLSGIGWGISFLFTFVSWDSAADQLYLMGAGRIEYNPMLDYWLRMTSVAFGCIGIASLLACWKTKYFEPLVILLAPFHLLVGIVLVHGALRNRLDRELHPSFGPDIVFCFVTALAIGLPCVVSRSNSENK